MCQENEALLISYDCRTGLFTCLSQGETLENECFVRQALCRNEADAAALREQVLAIAGEKTPKARVMKLCIGGRFYRAGIVSAVPGTTVTITLSDLTEEGPSEELDSLTGLMNRDAFCRAVKQRLHMQKEDGADSIVYIDLHRFKVVNELFGRTKGDELLAFLGNALRRNLKEAGFVCRLSSDRFAVFLSAREDQVEQLLTGLHAALREFDLPIEVTFNAGVYEILDADESVNAMIDRAAIAQASIKGNYSVRWVRYTPDMRKALLGEQEIMGMMAAALEEAQFVVHYQPQYNHSTGMLVGAEALVRWNHPENGLISPGVFIPIFEKNGAIAKLDFYVFRLVCRFLRKAMDCGWNLVPISVNFSRYDIFLPDFVRRLEDIRLEYNIPAKYLRVELTESVLVDGANYVNEVIRKLHSCGYIVEMDDFGSGYSSLNVLKDIDLDIIKLDMRFLSQSENSEKGGTILSSIVRMAKWLRLPVIAEGVETVEQADFLKSIGCEYIQGYLYSRPLTEEAYIALISASRIGATVPEMELIETLNAFNFWDPKSLETLIFSNFVGAAAIFDYCDGSLETLRVNQKYLRELGMNLSEKELVQTNLLETMDQENRRIYQKMLHQAIATMEEQECETWQEISSSCCGDERFCIRTSVRVIGVSGNRYLFHAMIRNITAERLYYDAVQDNDRRFRYMADQVNIYYWEYTIATKEMRPCFRCMRDLGLPPVLTNYPESAIEGGIFPPEVADEYRAFMQDIADGAPSKEGIFPLTMNRVPFHVRYTTEFDEYGHAVRAYGSAALVVN